MKELKIVLATPGPDTALMIANICRSKNFNSNDTIIELVFPTSKRTKNPYLNGKLNGKFIEGIKKFFINDIVVVEHDCTDFLGCSKYHDDYKSYGYAKEVAVRTFASMLLNNDHDMLDVEHEKVSIYFAEHEEDLGKYENDIYTPVFLCGIISNVEDVKILADGTRALVIEEIITDFPGFLGYCVDENYFSDYYGDVLLGISNAMSPLPYEETSEEDIRIIKEIYENNLVKSHLYKDIYRLFKHIIKITLQNN